jgi:hypothetical protein
LPPELHKKLVKAAGLTSSLNSEIIRRLQRSYDADELAEMTQIMEAARKQIVKEAMGTVETQRRIQEQLVEVVKRVQEVEALVRERSETGRSVPSSSNSNDL